MNAQSLERLDAALHELPLIAILRGLCTPEAEEIVQALFDEGIRVAEVPLNLPDALVTLERLVKRFGTQMVIGAGTVMNVSAVRAVAATGASLCVTPNTDPAVIRAAIDLGLAPVPGFATPSEAFAAVAAGARHLKLFPAAGRLADLTALRAVLPPGVKVLAVGGGRAGDLDAMLQAGAAGAGVGSDLYRPGVGPAQVRSQARAWREAYRDSRAKPVSELCWNPLATIGEGPVRRGDTVNWVDPVSRRLFAFQNGHGREVALSESVYSLAVLPDGTLVAALEDGLGVLDDRTGAVERRASASLAAGCRFNDMVVDARGGLWLGVMHKGLLATRGALYHASTVDGPLRRVADGLGVPNGMAFDSQGTTLYLIDTLPRHLLAFDVVGAQLGPPRIVTDFLDLPGKPDGMDIAPDGSLWVAMWGGGCVLRVGPHGAVEQEVRLPALHVSSVCAGAEGELWVTTSRARQTASQLAQTPGAGGLFRIRLR